jgi:hypothetical protein
VADSSLEYDRDIKLPLYAAAGIHECWLINIPENRIDCYSHPTAQGYRLRERFFAGDTIHLDRISYVTVDVTYVLDPLNSGL